MSKTLKICIAQQNYLVGDVEYNTEKIKHAIVKYQTGCDVIVFPELAITGYPPEDLLLREELQVRVEKAIQQIQKIVGDVYVLVGHPYTEYEHRFNAASILHQGKLLARYDKQHLPNYSVFDEKRYFVEGHTPCVLDLHGIPTALTLCEDLWHAGPMRQACEAGAKLVISMNASPFHHKKPEEREGILRFRQREEGALPIVYVNCVGGQDELVFDGQSFVLNAEGIVCARLNAYREAYETISCTLIEDKVVFHPHPLPPPLSEEALIYGALMQGTRDYVLKNRFKGVLLGLSGGIDSALTLAIASDALGVDAVEAVLMPSRYTAKMSNEDALSMVKQLGIVHREIPIESVFKTFLTTLKPHFQGLPPDVTEQNIQARIRGMILMALSNKMGKLVLTTGNKSEMAVGYSTLYGDMAGGFAVLKDVTKTWVYRLVDYRNRIGHIIPDRVIERPPSAELAKNQTDQDLLPSYDVIDQVIALYVENDQSIEQMIALGMDEDKIRKIVSLIDRNEYKRRQAPPGIRISHRAFGRDRRYPISSGFHEGSSEWDQSFTIFS